jgi:hypothetical protein
VFEGKCDGVDEMGEHGVTVLSLSSPFEFFFFEKPAYGTAVDRSLIS